MAGSEFRASSLGLFRAADRLEVLLMGACKGWEFGTMSLRSIEQTSIIHWEKSVVRLAIVVSITAIRLDKWIDRTGGVDASVTVEGVWEPICAFRLQISAWRVAIVTSTLRLAIMVRWIATVSGGVFTVVGVFSWVFWAPPFTASA